MPSVYIAMSQTMQDWGNDAGISKHLYRVGFTADAPEEAVKELNETGYGGQKDWTLVGARETDTIDEAALMTRLGERVKVIDPLYYPKIKGAKDIVKVEQRKVEANIVIKRTMEGRDSKVPKIKPKDMAAFILDATLGDSSLT
ncbi:MAG: hypothetical protein IT566_16290 [Rhodospirillaceae bacterium]|nr:hypothetical protein [Rhodospirillaceae bacterium]